MINMVLADVFKKVRERRFINNTEAIGIILGIGIIGLILFVVFGVMIFFFIQMLVQNIFPIAIGIVMLICLPILAKAYYAKTTGEIYGKKGGKA